MESPETGVDAELVARAREGSEKDFRRLVERYHPMAYAVVRGVLGDRADVEDVMQDVFIKVFRGLRGFRGDAKFSTWVFRIARNEALNAVRRIDRPSDSIEDIVIETPAETRPDEQYRRKIQREGLERCLSEIDEDYRVALEMRYMGEMSYAEISNAMGIPIGTVKTYIHRAKLELKRVMDRRRFVDAYGERGKV